MVHRSDITPYVINMKERNDRLETFEYAFKEYSLNCRRFNAVNGKKIDVSKYTTPEVLYNIKNDKIRKRHGDIPGVGAIGCALSHIKLWEQLVNDKSIFPLFHI